MSSSYGILDAPIGPLYVDGGIVQQKLGQEQVRRAGARYVMHEEAPILRDTHVSADRALRRSATHLMML